MNETEEQVSQEILSLDDIYFKDAFTKTEDKLNLEVNNADIDCITSRNNKFSLDSDGNLIVNSITTNSINAQNILDMIYPIGSIYITINDINPSTLFGGTWEQVKDTFLLGAGDKYPAETIGGEAEHILTINEMPKHSHTIDLPKGTSGANNTWYIGSWKNGKINRDDKYWLGTQTSSLGESKAHNNMPPYLTVYIWKRLS